MVISVRGAWSAVVRMLALVFAAGVLAGCAQLPATALAAAPAAVAGAGLRLRPRRGEFRAAALRAGGLAGAARAQNLKRPAWLPLFWHLQDCVPPDPRYHRMVEPDSPQ